MKSSRLLISFLLVFVMGFLIMAADSPDGVTSLADATYKGVKVFKFFEPIPADHPLAILEADGGKIYRYEYTDEYKFIKEWESVGEQTQDATQSLTQDMPLWDENRTHTYVCPEWLRVSGSVVFGLYNDPYIQRWCYQATVGLGSTYRWFLAAWDYIGPYPSNWTKSYYPQNFWLDEWFFWHDAYLQDGDQTGAYVMLNAAFFNQSYGGKGAYDHYIPPDAYYVQGDYYFQYFYSHQTSGYHPFNLRSPAAYELNTGDPNNPYTFVIAKVKITQ